MPSRKKLRLIDGTLLNVFSVLKKIDMIDGLYSSFVGPHSQGTASCNGHRYVHVVRPHAVPAIYHTDNKYINVTFPSSNIFI